MMNLEKGKDSTDPRVVEKEKCTSFQFHIWFHSFNRSTTTGSIRNFSSNLHQFVHNNHPDTAAVCSDHCPDDEGDRPEPGE